MIESKTNNFNELDRENCSKDSRIVSSLEAGGIIKLVFIFF